jgi:hypothetical protein
LLDDRICLDFETSLPLDGLLDGGHGGRFGGERGCGSEWR